MRKIAATYVFPCNRPPIKNGILACQNDGTIVEIIDNKGNLQEEAGLEFYSGILVPGFVITLFNTEISNTMERKLWAAGITAIGTMLQPSSILNSNNKIYYHRFTREYLHKEFSQHFSILHANLNDTKEELHRHLNSQNPNSNYCFALNEKTTVLQKWLEIQQLYPEISLQEIINWTTLNGAKALGIDKDFGSLEKGKKPGINLISGIDFKTMQLSSSGKVKRLQ